jgi:hypothetical protein
MRGLDELEGALPVSSTASCSPFTDGESGTIACTKAVLYGTEAQVAFANHNLGRTALGADALLSQRLFPFLRSQLRMKQRTNGENGLRKYLLLKLLVRIQAI